MANFGKGTKDDPYTNIVEYICSVENRKLYQTKIVKHPDDLRDIHGKLICKSNHVRCYYNKEDYGFLYKSQAVGGIPCWRNEKGDILPIDVEFDRVVYYKRIDLPDLNLEYTKIGKYKKDLYFLVNLYYTPKYDVHFIM